MLLIILCPSSPKGVTKAIVDHDVAAFEKDCTEKLTYIVDLVRGNLTNLQRITLGRERAHCFVRGLH